MYIYLTLDLCPEYMKNYISIIIKRHITQYSKSQRKDFNRHFTTDKLTVDKQVIKD